jgi:hypothetical protein
MTTGSAPRRASSAVKERPSDGCTCSTSKNCRLTRASVSRVGSPAPVTATTPALYLAIALNERVRSLKSVKFGSASRA